MQSSSYQLAFKSLTPIHQLPTNLTAARHPIHRWYNFIAGFSPEFVAECIRIQREEGQFSRLVLLDPFAGCGTSNVEANLNNVHSAGYEPHPFFADMARAKLQFPTDLPTCDFIGQIALTAVEHTADPETVWEPDALKFLQKLIPATELPTFAAACLLEDAIPVPLRPVYRMLISQVLELACTSQTDGIYKAPTTLKTAKPFRVALDKVLQGFRSDVALVGPTWENHAQLLTHTSEVMPELERDSCTLCVTSPPYLNNFDFAEMTRMELYYWRYARNWGEITERVRRLLVVNTTTAPTDLKRSQEQFEVLVPNRIRNTLARLSAEMAELRRHRAGKKEYHLLVFPYFGQMTRVLSETYRVLAPGGRLYLVVADSALYGIHVQTQLLLAQIMESVGFIRVTIHSLRERGYRWVLHKRLGPPKGSLGEFCLEAFKP